MDVQTGAGLAAAAFAAGGVNSVAGGGSLLSFPALLAAGYAPLQANVTNTVAMLPGYLGGSVAYREELRGQGTRVRELAMACVVGALAGSVLLLVSPAAVFRSIVPWLILLGSALVLVQPHVASLVQRRRGERGGGVAGEHGAGGSAALVAAAFGSAVYGAYFGAGLGVILLGLLGILVTDTMQRLNALKGLLSLLINLIGALWFALFGPVAWLPVLIMSIAALLGGSAGVTVARRIRPDVLRGVVVLVGVVAGIRLLLT